MKYFLDFHTPNIFFVKMINSPVHNKSAYMLNA